MDCLSAVLTGLGLFCSLWKALRIQVGNVIMKTNHTSNKKFVMDERLTMLRKLTGQMEQKDNAGKYPKINFEIHRQVLKLE